MIGKVGLIMKDRYRENLNDDSISILTKNQKHKKHPFLFLVKASIRIFYPRYVVEGKENIFGDGPAVFVCNHCDYNGPMSMELFFPYKFRPWVIHDMTSFKACPAYVEEHFFIGDLKMKRPLSKLLALLLTPISVMIMRAVEAIPVYRGGFKIIRTFRKSVDSILKGYDLVIFPEIKGEKYSKYIYDFYDGFAFLAKKLYSEIGAAIKFYPVYIDREKKKIIVGKPNAYSKGENMIVEYLKNAINDMAEKSAMSK